MPTIHPAVSRFLRSASRAAWLVGALRVLAVVATGAAAALLGLRLLGHHVPPTWWWSLGVLPVLIGAGWAVRRARLSPAAAAAHLDQRLGLRGLLVAAQSGGELDTSYQRRLQLGLGELPRVLPHVAWRQALPQPLLAALALTVVVLLPPPEPQPVPLGRSELAIAQVEQVERGLRDLFDRGEVPEDIKDELQRRLGELKDAVAAGRAVDWRDLDDLEQRLEREAQLQRLAQVAQRSNPAGRQVASKGARPSPDSQQLAAAAKALLDAGLLDAMSSQLQAALRNARLPDGSFDPSKLDLDPAALAELLQQMGGLADRLGQLAQGLDPAQLQELQRLAQEFAQRQFGAGAGEGSQPGFGSEGPGGNGPGGQWPGGGGVGRGPGHATLQLSDDHQGGASADLKLPAGAPLPGDWVPVGSSLRPAEAAPQPNTAPGGAAAAGSGGATWQLDLAPRHRAVVRRYFAGQEKR